MYWRSLPLLAGLVTVALCSGGGASAQTQAPAVGLEPAVAWIRRHAIPVAPPDSAADFRDLEPLRRLIGNARIVALGEGTHGTHEFFVMKRRLTEFLAREMGFTIFAMEANLPEAKVINDYVHAGQGDPATVVKGLAFWTWTTEELTDLVRWMRAYNVSGGRMDFAGVDIQLPAAAQRNVVDLTARADSMLARVADSVYRRITPDDRRYVVGIVTLPAAATLAGHRVRLSARVRGSDLTGFAGLYLGPDGPAGPLPRTTSTPDDGVGGTTDWKPIELTADIPSEATTLRTGFLLGGSGAAWFEDVQLDIEGAGIQRLDSLDYRLESRPAANAERYEMRRDSGAIRIASRDPAGSTPSPGEAFAAARAVAERIEAAAPAWTKSLPADTIAWLVHNARMVAQSYQWQADSDGASREVSMAENIKWLLDRAPTGTRVVVWAHNGHVSRNPRALGARLAELYPGQMVNLGFTTSEGWYNAETRTGSIQSFPLTPPPAGSVESFFRASGIPNFVLDIRGAKAGDRGAGWLTEERPFRFIGISGTEDQFFPFHITREFDALIYFDRTRASRLLE